MPNRKAHLKIGAVTGAFATAVSVGIRYARKPEAPFRPLHDIAEILGGAGAGALGGALPDVLEPAVHPNHRAFAHSAVAGGATSSLPFVAAAISWQDACQDRAEEFRAQRLRAWYAFLATQGLDALLHLLKAAFYLLAELVSAALAGGPVGLAAGYVSHLAADSL